MPWVSWCLPSLCLCSSPAMPQHSMAIGQSVGWDRGSPHWLLIAATSASLLQNTLQNNRFSNLIQFLDYLCFSWELARSIFFHMDFSFYISTLSFKGKSQLAQGLGHLVLVGITVQEQFHWPKHTELQQILRRAVLHLSQLHRSAANAILYGSSPSERIYWIHWIKGEKAKPPRIWDIHQFFGIFCHIKP